MTAPANNRTWVSGSVSTSDQYAQWDESPPSAPLARSHFKQPKVQYKKRQGPEPNIPFPWPSLHSISTLWPLLPSCAWRQLRQRIHDNTSCATKRLCHESPLRRSLDEGEGRGGLGLRTVSATVELARRASADSTPIVPTRCHLPSSRPPTERLSGRSVLFHREPVCRPGTYSWTATLRKG